MKILVISDTHGHGHILEGLLAETGSLDALIHCGDVEGEEDYISVLAKCPCYFVAGNCDYFSNLDRELLLELAGKKLFITHGHLYGVHMSYDYIIDEGRERSADLVLFGHSHMPVYSDLGDMVLLNPGSLALPRQRPKVGTYALLEIGEEGNVQVEFGEV